MHTHPEQAHKALIAGLCPTAAFVFESINHLRDVTNIETGPLIAGGLGGLAVNFLGVRLLHGDGSHNLNGPVPAG